MVCFRINGHVSFTDIRNKIGIENLSERRKGLREEFNIKAFERVPYIPDFELIEKKHNTLQQPVLFTPSISTKSYFYLFCPKTTQDLHGFVL